MIPVLFLLCIGGMMHAVRSFTVAPMGICSTWIRASRASGVSGV